MSLIEDWLDGLNIHNPTVVKERFKDQGITDQNTLPSLGLTASDLNTLNFSLADRQRILNLISSMAPVAAKPVTSREPSKTAEARRDLIKRLVPVAISVGFAARLLHMDWIEGGGWPNYAQFEELARLGTAMFMIVSGWEWYNRDVEKRPLEKPYRFIIDVAVVILGMIFLYSSKSASHWFLALIGIFILYVVWDVFSIREYPGDYGILVPGGVTVPSGITVPSGQPPASLGDIIGVYWDGFWNGNWRGPITNATWLLYFSVIPALSVWVFKSQNHQAFVASFFIFLGAVALLFDGSHEDKKTPNVLGFKTQHRAWLIIGLVVGYLAVSALLWCYAACIKT